MLLDFSDHLHSEVKARVKGLPWLLQKAGHSVQEERLGHLAGAGRRTTAACRHTQPAVAVGSSFEVTMLGSALLGGTGIQTGFVTIQAQLCGCAGGLSMK